MTRLLLVSDLHGSNAAFSKLVRLAVQLSVDVVVIAGDFCGKTARLILRNGGGGYVARDESGALEEIPAAELERRRVALGDEGIYPILAESDWPDARAADALLSAAIVRRLRQWLDYGQAVLGGRRVACLAIPGNDDPPHVVEVLDSDRWARNIDGRVETLEGYEFFGLGYSTPTPWRTFRELTEETIGERLAEIGCRLTAPRDAVAVVHVPPRDSGLDMAAELVRDADGMFRETGYGETPVGSVEVRRFVERVQPMALFCGHCHTSRGIRQLGRTVCINPGSASHRGVLYAVLLVLEGRKPVSFQYFMA